MPTENRDHQEPVRAVARLFALQLLAVVAIATVITVLATLLAGDDQGSLTTTVPGSSEPAPATSAESSPPPSPAPSSEQPAPTAPASSSAPAPEATPRRMRVDVLNQSAGSGVAESTAQRLRDRGWRIGRVDDFSGTVTTTTVYYPANRQGQARRLARDLPGSPRLLERFSTLSDSRLSVVLVD